MPGLSQLEQFNRDILALGDELKIRTARGEKPVRVPIPKNVEDRDDSEDFADGIPQLSEDEITQAEAAAAEREREKYDFSAITGETSSESKKTDSSHASSPAPVVLPDVSDILNTAADLSLDDTDLSEFEDPEPEPDPEPKETPIEDMDLDALLQFTDTPSEEDAGAIDEPSDSTVGVSSVIDDDFSESAIPAGADNASEDVTSSDIPSADGTSESSRMEDFNSKLDSLAENADAPVTTDFDMDAASAEFSEVPDGTSQTVDLSSELPDELSMPDDDETPPADDNDLASIPDEGAPAAKTSEDIGG
ncbi:MAG: hypothetical protein IJ828_09215, partial [Treponema sp.]|nr:hypothetical protein [Treponema sp.]